MNTVIEDAILKINKPEEVMKFFDDFISYGCIGVDKTRYVDSLGGSNFRTDFRTLSLEDSLNERIGACIEQTNITKYIMDQIGIRAKTFCIRGFKDEQDFPNNLYLVHCFTLEYLEDGSVINVEHSDTELQDIYRYTSEKEALEQSEALFGGKFRKHGAIKTIIDEYDEFIPGGLSFDEFNRFINRIGKRVLG